MLGAALLCQWRGNGLHKSYTHGFHSRKAVMNPFAVSQLLQLLPGQGAIIDPFVGSGTTVIEVLLAGRAAAAAQRSRPAGTLGAGMRVLWEAMASL